MFVFVCLFIKHQGEMNLQFILLSVICSLRTETRDSSLDAPFVTMNLVLKFRYQHKTLNVKIFKVSVRLCPQIVNLLM